mmetsp:Transcript_17990/g.48948  ORF Transcript_17990/g.48948 Transcript_17990/m.48948 type:complete len:486 (-) Transcript_17990:895-2352(-)
MMSRPPHYLCDVTEEIREVKPWLISTKEELIKDEFDHDEYVSTWLQQFPFPGIEEPKLPWLKKLQQLYREERDAKFNSKAPDAFQVASTELLRHAPNYIHLEIRAKKSSVRNVNTVKDEQFAQGLGTLGRSEYKGKTVWSGYRTWLCQQPEDDQGLVTLGYIKCHKQDETAMRITEFLEGMGLAKSFLMALLVDSEAACRACPDWGLMKRVGENIYVPKGNQFVLPVRVAFRARTTIDDQLDNFLDPLRKIKACYKNNKHPKDFICVARRRPLIHSSQSPGQQHEKRNQVVLTKENTMVLWLPLEYQQERKRVFAHFCGEGEARHIIDTLLHGQGQDASNLMVDICHRNLAYLKSKKVKTTRAKFCLALALTMRASQSTQWMQTNPTVVQEFLSGLADFWKKLLTTKTDRQLGIGIKSENHRDHPIVFSETNRYPEMSESRTALDRLLKLRARAFHPYSFEWNPAMPRSRKRKASALNVMQQLNA